MTKKRSYGEEQEMFIDYYNAVRNVLDNAQRGILLDLMVDFLENGELQNIDDNLVAMAFCFIKNGLERVTERYERRRETNRKNVNKRWGNE